MRLNFLNPLESRYVEAQAHASTCFPELLIRQLVTTMCTHLSLHRGITLRLSNIRSSVDLS